MATGIAVHHSNSNRASASLEIVEQPKSMGATRFRYECEKRSAGNICGERDNNCPSIKVYIACTST